MASLPIHLPWLRKPRNPEAAPAAAPAPQPTPAPAPAPSRIAAELSLLTSDDKSHEGERDALRLRLRGVLQRVGLEPGEGGQDEEERQTAALFLEAHDFEAALSFCAPTDRPLHEAILSAQAAAAFERGEYVRAAKLWAKTRAPLEQVALRFHEAGLHGPLKDYLSDMVDGADEANASQLTLLCAWLTQLYVSDAASLDGDGDGEGAAADVSDEFWAFLADKQRHGHLDRPTTYRLLSAHSDGGRMLLAYASLCADWPRVVAFHLEHGDARDALAALAQAVDSGGDAGGAAAAADAPLAQLERLVEANAGRLMASAPRATVDVLLRLPGIDPTRLLPALAHYHAQWMRSANAEAAAAEDGGGEGGGERGGERATHEGLRYLSEVRVPAALAASTASVLFEATLLFHSAASDDATLRDFLLSNSAKSTAAFGYCERTLTQQGRHEGACVLLQLAGQLERLLLKQL